MVLVLRNEKTSAVVFEELNGKIKVIGEGAGYFTDTIENASIEEMLDVLDRAISNAESDLPENIQTEKTIFGVKESWVEENKIKKEYLAKLKKISDTLGLTPIGFLIIPQAIVHFLQKEEGAPVSAILVEVGNKSVMISLVRAGRIVETKSSEIHESVPLTVDTLLKHLQAPEILPSRVIIFDGESDLSQKLLAHRWTKSLPFLHLPQITQLSNNFDARSVLFGAATQMGFEVLKEEKEEEELQAHNYSLDNFGFAKDKDVAYEPLSEHQEKIKTHEKVPKILPLIKKIFAKVITLVRKIEPGKLKKLLSFFYFNKNNKKAFLVPAVFLAIIIGFFLYYSFGVHATITINIKPKIAEQDKSVDFSIAPITNKEAKTIPGELVSISQEGNVTTEATGRLEVGDKSKGIVTVFSGISQTKTLAKGTVITSPNDLRFLLDQDLTTKGVATHSADETVAPSKADVSVTAAQIGKESNLPSGTKFIVSTFDTSEIVAKNDNPFSGGTKKEVTVASKNDVATLEEELPKKLEQKAKEDLGKKILADQEILPAFISQTLTNKKIDPNVGEQGDKVTLKATVTYQSIAYKKNDIIELARSLLEDNIPKDTTIDYNNIKISVKNVKKKNDKEILANLNIKGLLMPKVDKKTLASDLAGVSYEEAKSKLERLPYVSSITISFSPNFPLLPKILPKLDKNIIIKTKLND